MTVLVIGAGPAGLAAALAAVERGQPVTLLDASDDVGGQYWRHLPEARPSDNEAVLHHGWSTFVAMRERLARTRCEIVTSAHVWAIDHEGVHVVVGDADGTNRERRTYRADAIVVATGAFDRVLPVPGWDLPGVFSAGGAQALAKGERVSVGRRVLVAGAGPFLFPVAVALLQGGSTVVGVLEASRMRRMASGWATRPWELAGARAKIPEVARYAYELARHRVPYSMGRAVTAIHGDERVESVTTAAVSETWAPIAGTDRNVAVDAVCLGHGWTPRLELAIALGCQLTDRRFVAIDENQRTSVEHIYAAGEITGIGGVDLALAEGTIAGHVAAGGQLDDAAIRPTRARRATWRRFAVRLDAAHGIGEQWSEWLRDETVVCRCEEVTVARLRSVANETQSKGLRSLKLTSRAGLGICQGRVCGRTIESLWGSFVGGGGLNDGVITDRRPVALPVRLGELRVDAKDAGTDERASRQRSS
jgi:NADPH-dependent 2,4-dienoyl-CoA reductase/sulfur reductase-like enzyme